MINGSSTIGSWYIGLNYKGSAEVGICGGENDVIHAILTVYFKKGDLAGKNLVLAMQDNVGAPIYWYWYDTPCTTIGGSGCNCPSPYINIENPNCTKESGSNLAYIDNLPLSPRLGTTLTKISKVTLSGWLCHTYPVVPQGDSVLHEREYKII